MIASIFIAKLRKYQNGFALLSLLFLSAGLYTGLVVSPPDYYQGEVVRIMYIHVPFAEAAMAAYTVLFAGSLWYLWKRDPVIDNMCHAAAGIGILFTSVALITGSIWAKPTWNTWWTWDPRLTTAAVTELIYIAYFMLRQGIEDPGRRARFGAVYTVLGAISAPITFFAIRLFRTIHPVVIGSGDPSAQGTFAMSAGMKLAFFFALFAFTIIFVDLFWNRIRMGRLAEKVEQLKLSLMG